MLVKEVPKQNVDAVFVDVKRPNTNYKRLARIKKIELGGRPARKKKSRLGWIIAGGSVSVMIVLAFAFFLGASNIKETAEEKGKIIAANFFESAKALGNLDTEGAAKALEKNAEELKEVQGAIRGRGKSVVIESVGSIFPAVQSGLSLFSEVTGFNVNLLDLTEHIRELQTNGFTYVQTNGARLIAILRETKNLIDKLNEEAINIKNKTGELANISDSFSSFNEKLSDTYIKYTSDLHSWNGALQEVINLLDSKIDRNILLIFHNPTEMRPSGGFIGSYGVITINEGQMTNLEVNDIYWPDHEMNFDRKLIPPLPLQRVTEDWGTRDANWFFDFPTSAETVISFLESSKIYKENGITFDGAIAINTNILETVMELIGPIYAEEYDLVIDSNNFLAELQREVETGKDKIPGQNPKRILSVITPEIMSRLGTLPAELRPILIKEMGEHIEKKDIMLYMREGGLASFLEKEGIDGGVWKAPHTFWGGYLAVVNANIAGGKSDAFIKESIRGRIDVNTDGGTFTNLVISRKHTGENEKDPWYKADNKNFMQIYTNKDASLVAIGGNTAKKAIERTYDEEYEKIPALEKIEDTIIELREKNAWTMEAFGKKVFAAWLDIEAGEVGDLKIKYQTPPREGSFRVQEDKSFVFVFERQSGVDSEVSIDITAPVGYTWRESESHVYAFEREHPLGREQVELHLIKN